MADDFSGDIWSSINDWNPFAAGGIFSTSGHGIFAPSGTAPTPDNPNAIVPGYAPDNYTPLPPQTWGQTLSGAAAKLPQTLKAGAAALKDAQNVGAGSPAQAPGVVAAANILKGATPARITPGQSQGGLNAVLQEMARRQQAVGSIGLNQGQTGPRPGYSVGLLGV